MTTQEWLSETEAKRLIVMHAASIFSRGLTFGASANMSVRIESGFVITPTNTCFGFLEKDQLAVVDKQGTLISGLKPSKEFKIHKAIYDKRPMDQCVIHLHSTYATALSCLPTENASDAVPCYTPYLTMRLGEIAMVPYFSPGADALAEAVTEVAERYAGILMANHGPIVSAPTVESCVYGMEELEETCKIALLLAQTNATKLSAEQINRLKKK